MENKQLIEFLDAIRCLAGLTWSDGGLDYELIPVTGDLENALQRNRDDLLSGVEKAGGFQAASIGEFSSAFAAMMKDLIGAESESLGVLLARLLSDPHTEPSLQMLAYADEDVWVFSVVNTNSEEQHVLNMTFQYD